LRRWSRRGEQKVSKVCIFLLHSIKSAVRWSFFIAARKAAFFDKSICGYVGKVKSHRVFFTDLSEELGHFERSFQANSYQSICD